MALNTVATSKYIKKVRDDIFIPLMKSNGFTLAKRKKVVFEVNKEDFRFLIYVDSHGSSKGLNINGNKIVRVVASISIETIYSSFSKWKNDTLKEESRELSIKKPVALIYKDFDHQDFSYNEFYFHADGHYSNSYVNDDSNIYNEDSFDKVIDHINEAINEEQNHVKLKEYLFQYSVKDKCDYLSFAGRIEEAKELLHADYQEKLKVYHREEGNLYEKNQILYGIVFIVKYAKNLFDETWELPQEKENYRFVDNAKNSIRFTKDIEYTGLYSLDINSAEVEERLFNSSGYHFVLGKTSYLFSPKQELVKKFSEDEINRKLVHFSSNNNAMNRWIESNTLSPFSDGFILGCYVVFNDGRTITLNIPEEKPPHFTDLLLIDAKFISDKNEFIHLLYSIENKRHFILKYDIKGKLLKLNTFSALGSGCHIIPQANGIIHVNKELKKAEVFGLDGNKVFTDKLSGEFSSFAVSPNGEFAIIYGWHALGNLFDLKTGKKKVLRIHPTQIKGYKKTFYQMSKVYCNFSLGSVSFSPDSTYVVCTSSYGRNAIFKLPSLERIELIPSADDFHRFEWDFKLYDSKQIIQTKHTPIIINFKGVDYFHHNAEVGGAKALFINESIFFFQYNDFILVWNKDGEHINTIEGDSLYYFERGSNFSGPFISDCANHYSFFWQRNPLPKLPLDDFNFTQASALLMTDEPATLAGKLLIDHTIALDIGETPKDHLAPFTESGRSTKNRHNVKIVEQEATVKDEEKFTKKEKRSFWKKLLGIK